jgi:hypothetical protein
MLGGVGGSGAKASEKIGESEIKTLATKRKEWALTGKAGKAIGEEFKKKDKILQNIVGRACKRK